MLTRFMNLGNIISPLVLLTFLMTTIGWSWPAEAQESMSSKPARVLFVPIQRSQDVPEGVPARVEEYLKALIEINPKVKLISMGPEMTVEAPEPASQPEPPPPPKVEPVKSYPEIEKAMKLAAQGKDAIQAKRYEKGLQLLIQARDLFIKRLAELEDFEQFLDTVLWIAIGFIEGGYTEEGSDALNGYVVMRPDAVFDNFSKGFLKTLDAAKARLKKVGTLIVTATPPDASIYVDGRLVGQGSANLEGLAKGRHFVRVVADGHAAQGKLINVGDKETNVTIALKSLTPASIAKPKGPAKPSDEGDKPLTWYARTGEYFGRFPKTAKTAAEKQMADYVLFSYMARSEASFLLGLFIFNASTQELAWVEPAVIDTDLGNLQIALLDLESRLSAALLSYPKDRIVKTKPSIYTISVARAVQTPAPVTAPTAPVVVKADVVEPAPKPVTPASEKVTTAAVPAQVPTGEFDEIPEDFPMETIAPVPQRETSEPWYKKWWVWTIAGVVVAGAATATAVMVTRGGGGERFTGSATW